MQTLQCTETLISPFLYPRIHEKTPSKVGYFNKITEISVLPKTAQSSQRQQKYNMQFSVFSTWMYNFGSWLPFDVVIAFEVQGGWEGLAIL